MKDGLITSLSETETFDKSKTCGILLKKISDEDFGNWSCEVKSKAGVEAIVLPVDFPGVPAAALRGGNEGKDQRDWTGMEDRKLIDTIPEWGPFYRVSFDLFLNSLPLRFSIGRMTSAQSSVLAFRKNWHDPLTCYQCFKLWSFLGKPVLQLEAVKSSSNNIYRFQEKNLEIKKWYKIELERRQLEKKDWKYERKANRPVFIFDSYISLKINGTEVAGQKTHSYAQWDKGYKNVSLLSGNDIQQQRVATYIPDIKIKNLEYKNLFNEPEYVNGVWKEKKMK